MAEIIDIDYAKTHFSKLLARASAGAEIVISKGRQPIARLSPILSTPAKQGVPGIDKGKIWMAKDFDVLSEQKLDDWYRS